MSQRLSSDTSCDDVEGSGKDDGGDCGDAMGTISSKDDTVDEGGGGEGGVVSSGRGDDERVDGGSGDFLISSILGESGISIISTGASLDKSSSFSGLCFVQLDVIELFMMLFAIGMVSMLVAWVLSMWSVRSTSSWSKPIWLVGLVKISVVFNEVPSDMDVEVWPDDAKLHDDVIVISGCLVDDVVTVVDVVGVVFRLLWRRSSIREALPVGGCKLI